MEALVVLVPLQLFLLDFMLFQSRCPLSCPLNDEIPSACNQWGTWTHLIEESKITVKSVFVIKFMKLQNLFIDVSFEVIKMQKFPFGDQKMKPASWTCSHYKDLEIVIHM